MSVGANWKSMTNHQFNSLGHFAVRPLALHLPGLFLGRLFASRTGKARVFNVARCAVISGSGVCAPELPSRTDAAPRFLVRRKAGSGSALTGLLNSASPHDGGFDSLASLPVPACFFWLRRVNRRRHSLGRLLVLNGGLRRV